MRGLTLHEVIRGDDMGAILPVLDGALIVAILTALWIFGRRDGATQARLDVHGKILEAHGQSLERIEQQVVNPNSGGMRQNVNETRADVAVIKQVIEDLPGQHLLWHARDSK